MVSLNILQKTHNFLEISKEKAGREKTVDILRFYESLLSHNLDTEFKWLLNFIEVWNQIKNIVVQGIFLWTKAKISDAQLTISSKITIPHLRIFPSSLINQTIKVEIMKNQTQFNYFNKLLQFPSIFRFPENLKKTMDLFL